MKSHFPKNIRHQLSRCARLLVMVLGVCSCVGLIGCGAAEPEARDNGASATTDRVQAGPANKVRANFQNVDPE